MAEAPSAPQESQSTWTAARSQRSCSQSLEFVSCVGARSGRTKTGRAWASQTIANILSNPVYCGLARLNGGIKRGKHEPLIEIDTFNRVQNEMQRRIRRPDQRKEQTPQFRLEDYT